MDGQREFSDFLLELYSGVHASDEADFRTRMLSRLSRLIGFDCAVWGGGQAEDRQVTDLAIVEHDPALLMKWQDVADQDGFCDLTLRRMGQACTFDDVEGFRSSMAYHEHWRAYGVNQMMSVIAAEPLDGYVSFLGLCREETPRRFDEDSRALMTLLVPHLSQAWRLRREGELARMSQPGEALALLDGTGRMLASHGPTATLMRAEWRQARVVPLAVMQRAKSTGAWRGNALQFSLSPARGVWLARMCPVSVLNRLSAREQQVAELFASGLSHKEVARSLGTAPGTVRNQIARIYEKLGIAGKAELAQCVALGG